MKTKNGASPRLLTPNNFTGGLGAYVVSSLAQSRTNLEAHMLLFTSDREIRGRVKRKETE